MFLSFVLYFFLQLLAAQDTDIIVPICADDIRKFALSVHAVRIRQTAV